MKLSEQLDRIDVAVDSIRTTIGLENVVIEDVAIGTANKIDELNSTITSQSETIVTKETEIAGLNETVTSKDNEISSLNETIGEKDATIISLNSTIEGKDNTIATLQSQISDLEEQLPEGNTVIIENGTHNVAAYETATINVPITTIDANLEEKTITANGTYSAIEDGLDGYSSVIINTPQPPEEGYVVEEYNASGYPSKIRLDNVTSLAKGFIPSAASFVMKGTPHITINSTTLKTLPSGAFYQGGACTITLPDTIETCPTSGDGVFANSQIDMVKLPNNLFYIPANFCAYDSKLKSLKQLPPYVNYVGTHAFNSTGLTQLEIPDHCYQLEAWAFQKSKLTEITIPAGVVTLSGANQLFDSCTSLRKITFLGDMTFLGTEWASNCSVLSEVWLPNVSAVPSATYGEDRFSNTPIASGSGSIYVPSGLVDAFKTHSDWSAFASTIKPIPLTSIKLKAHNKMNVQATDKLRIQVLYNGNYAPVSEEYEGYTLDITGPATMGEDGFLTLTSEAVAGDKITVRVTSNYNADFTDELEIDVLSTNKWYTIDFNNGQWKEAPTLTKDGHKQYMSDAGSFGVEDSTSISSCTITVHGYTTFTMGLRSCCWGGSVSCDASKANQTSVSSGYGFITTRYKAHGYNFCTGTYSLNGGTNTILVRYSPGSSYYSCDPNRSFMWIDPSFTYIETYE